MARLATCGFEIGAPDSHNTTTGDPLFDCELDSSGSGAAIVRPSPLGIAPRSGNYMFWGENPGPSSQGDGYATVRGVASIALGTTVFARAYLYFPSNWPATNAQYVMQIQDGSANPLVAARLSTSGLLELVNATTGAVIGSGTQLALGTWYRVELAVKLAKSASDDYAEMLVGGVSIASTTTASIGTAAFSNPSCAVGVMHTAGGWPTNTFDVFADDVAVNDSTGTAQNSWPGEGSVVCLFPQSDTAQLAGWKNGTGGTTSLFDALDNIPPQGKAAAGIGVATQIQDAVKSSTDNYQVNLHAYSDALGTPVSAGVATSGGGGALLAGDTITLVQPMISIGVSGTTARSMGVSMISNPAITEVTGNTPAAAVNTWSIGWGGLRGGVSYAPSVTLGTAPVMQIGKRASVTDTLYVSAAALIVEYVRPVVQRTPKTCVIGQAVKRALSW